MVSQTLLVGAALALLSGCIYAYIGYRLTRRNLPREGKLAAAAFVTFWYGLAVSAITGPMGAQSVLAAAGVLTLPVALLLGQVGLVAICLALWGLLYYLVYLYTGKYGAWKLLAGFYVAFYVFLQYFLISLNPVGIKEGRWSVQVEYASNQSGAEALTNPYVILLLVGLLLPQIVASLAYLTLGFRVSDPTQRYRIFLVSISIFVWFASPFIGLGFVDSPREDTWSMVSRFIGLGAAITIFLAYHPPRFIRRKGILGLGETSPEPAKHEEPPAIGIDRLRPVSSV